MKFFEPVGRVCRSPFGQLYFILAKKRVLPVNPLHSSWLQQVSPARGARVKQGQPQSWFGLRRSHLFNKASGLLVTWLTWCFSGFVNVGHNCGD